MKLETQINDLEKKLDNLRLENEELMKEKSKHRIRSDELAERLKIIELRVAKYAEKFSKKSNFIVLKKICIKILVSIPIFLLLAHGPCYNLIF
jgi:predicted nuclease with TOPRIM domain